MAGLGAGAQLVLNFRSKSLSSCRAKVIHLSRNSTNIDEIEKQEQAERLEMMKAEWEDTKEFNR